MKNDIRLLSEAYGSIYRESVIPKYEPAIDDILMNEDGDEFSVVDIRPDGDILVVGPTVPSGQKKLITADELLTGAYLKTETD